MLARLIVVDRSIQEPLAKTIFRVLIRTGMNVELIVRETLRQVTGSEEVVVNPDLPLFESGLLDSLNVAELLAGLSEKLDAEIPLTAFDQPEWATPAKVASAVRKVLSM